MVDTIIEGSWGRYIIGKIQFYIAREMHEHADCPYFCRKMLSLPEKMATPAWENENIVRNMGTIVWPFLVY